MTSSGQQTGYNYAQGTIKRSSRHKKRRKLSFLKVIRLFIIFFILWTCSYFAKGMFIEVYDALKIACSDFEQSAVENNAEESSWRGNGIGNAESSNTVEKNNTTGRNAKAGGSNSVLTVDENNMLILVNKNHDLPENYEPSDLIKPNVRFLYSEEHPAKYMRQEAALALEELFKAADAEGINLYAVSGYRSYSTQKVLFDNKLKAVGSFEQANQTVAYPGQSEHQTGLAMDISSQSVNFGLVKAFGTSKEGMWVAKNCHKYGFILRYPKEKESITGYTYEPWHIRYVGKEAAQEIYEKGLVLEEYLESF